MNPIAEKMRLSLFGIWSAKCANSGIDMLDIFWFCVKLVLNDMTGDKTHSVKHVLRRNRK